MSVQLRIPGVDPPRQIHPTSERAEPTVWVRRLRILRALSSGDEHVIRDVELRRGLNIVWAPPHESAQGNGLFQNGVAGHTAGKSTFCRLLRHVLGERGFAPEGTRRRIRGQLPAAWVVAEVVVNGSAWVVARPFGIGPRPFCVRGGLIEQVAEGGDRLDYQKFLDAIGSATTDGLAAARFPATDEPIRWEHLLQWLSRDQECRFADFLEWRHSSSDSEAPGLNVDERQFLIRSVLGLISDEERVEQQTNARLVSRKRDATQREPLLLHQARADHARVSAALGVDLPFPSTPLFGSTARAELDRRTTDLRRREEELSAADQRATLQAALEAAIAAETNARRNLQEAETRLILEQAAVEQLAGDSQSSLLAALPPARDYCSVPMTLAREHGCPLATSPPIDLASRRSERTAAEELELQRRRVEAVRASVATYRSALGGAKATTASARRALMVAGTAFDERRGKLLEERAQLSQIARLVHDAEAAWRQASEQADAVTAITREMDDSYARQEQIRSESREAIGRFCARFDYVVRAILGEEVVGRVDTAGRSLSLCVEEHGERDSAAIATVKLLAFDLAALAASAEGHGRFPRFLIHDGPREADMAPDIYERLFLFARELEKCFPSEPSFQYILTTTTQPPDAFQKEPWLRLRLAGVPAEERFLRSDL